MNHRIKNFIRKSARRHYSNKNHIYLRIMNWNKQISIGFHKKPPSEIRRYMRTHNFKWSRKYRYWISYLSRVRLQSVEKIIRFTEKKLNANE